MLEDEAKKIINWQLLTPPDKPQRVEYEDYGKFIVETKTVYGLDVKAQSRPGPEWGHSSDGADFSRSRGHDTAGECTLDLDAIDPLTKERLFDDGVEKRTKIKNYHVSTVCNHMVCAESIEKKSYIKKISAKFFKFIEDTEEKGFNLEAKLTTSTPPFQLTCHVTRR